MMGDESRDVVTFWTGGPSVCESCGRTFTSGGMVDHIDSATTIHLCIWCIAQLLELITGWAITDQMRGWLVSRERRPQKWEPAPLVHPDIVTE